MYPWFIVMCSVVFLFSCANTYIQAKRRAFILTCLGFAGILFCLSFLIAAISLPGNKQFNDLNKAELIICHVTGILLAIQSMALFSIVFALSIELYVTFRIKNRAIRDSFILKSVIVFFCCFQPTLCVILNIILMLVDNIPIVDIIEGGWCNVIWGGNQWGVLFVRVLPFLFISIPGSLIACAAIIPSLITAIKAQRKHRESPSQSETNPTITSDSLVRPTSPTSPVLESSPSDLPSTSQSSNKIPNEAITRMALYCFLYTMIGFPYSIYSLVKYFKSWDVPISLDEITFCSYLSVGIGMATLTIVFFIFATNDSSIKRYKEAYGWWKFRFFSPVYDYIAGRKNDSIHVNIVRNVVSNSEKEPRESVSISIRTVVTEGNMNLSNEMQEELPATVSSRNSITSKTKKRWSIFATSGDNLIETKKIRQSIEDTTSSIKDENSSPSLSLINQKTNRNICHNLSTSSSSSYSSTTALTIDPEPSPQQNTNNLSNKSPIPTFGGLSPAPRRTPPLSSPLRDYNDNKDDETVPSSSPIKRSSSPQIRNSSLIPRQSASAPTSPITSRPNSLRDRYNSPRRFTSPLNRPSSPIISSSTRYGQETRTTNTTYENIDDDDEIEPFPSLLKIGKTFNDEKGIWRPASTSSFASRSIRMSGSGLYNSNAWIRPNTETINRLSSSPTSPITPGNLFKNNLPIINDVNGSSSNGNGNGKNK
ncbi:hypothetical protein RclHR1_05680010 [Rhizophagus clarus]|uniref:Uncharacterized protein n=1 Tax=Rhizophagus clarus TaxID=94130 RepID=A0A2Z6S0Z1_9GLOM|nr:hypothetical protein RclHR1_05680010 [Rhizophagus clarus]GES98459.1 hypothetical protein GLOIN_2v1562098 [Rhizophagus clarus]